MSLESLLHTKGPDAYFQPCFSASTGKAEKLQQRVEKEFLKEVTEAQAKRAKLPSTYNCNSINPSLARFIYESMMFKPTDLLASELTMLAQDHVDAGVAEVLLRCLPGLWFKVMPAGLTHFVVQTLRAAQTELLVPQGTKHERYGETDQCKKSWMDHAKNALTLCIPIFNGNHRTLLTAEREGADSASASAMINPLGSFNREQRKAAEHKQFHTEEWTQLSEECLDSKATLTYFDSLPQPMASSRLIASVVVSLLKEAGWNLASSAAPPRQNSLFQQENPKTTCGLYALHYIEEKARAFRGELPGTMPCNLKQRKDRVNAILPKLKQKAGNLEVVASGEEKGEKKKGGQ